MKRLFAGLGLCFAFAVLSVHGQSADDQYVRIYTLIQQGDALSTANQPKQALEKYQQAQSDLERFKRVNPDWNKNILNFREAYLAAHIAEEKTQLPATTTAPAPAGNSTSTNSVSPPSSASTDRIKELEGQLRDLQNQVQQLQADKQTTEAKLKEALSARPAAVDPQEMAKASARVAQLEKDNSLLKVSLNQLKSQTEQVTQAKANAEAAQQLAVAKQKLEQETARADKLAAANQTLQKRLEDLNKSPQAIAALQAENALLKKQVARLKTSTTPVANNSDWSRQLADARDQIAKLQTDNQALRLAKTALQDRVKKLTSATTTTPVAPTPAVAPASTPTESARIKQLEQERDALQKKLDTADQELSGRETEATAAQMDTLTGQLNDLRAKLAVYEAQAVPYTPEELALFKAPTVAPVASQPNGGRASITTMSADTSKLAAEAQRHFAAKQFDKAAEDYQRILKGDENNTYALANLAAIEVEMNHLDEAQKHIMQAVQQSPNDAYNLSILGYLRLQQGKYDEALSALSRAAKLDPNNAEIENYLGVVLSHKGLRNQAETALRKAIQINPKYGSAHNNLAVIYITQKPPLVALARWHYQKALADGQPRNSKLEKLLKENAAEDPNK